MLRFSHWEKDSSIFSGASAGLSGRQAEPCNHIGKKGNPRSDFLMVIMASNTAHGRVGRTATATVTATTVESRKIAAIL